MSKIKTLIPATIFFIIFFCNTLCVSGQDRDDSPPWMTFDEMIESNQNQPKKIMLFMEADWCGICKRMKREVFPDPTIQTLLEKDFYPVRIDIESEEEIQFSNERITMKELSKQFGIRGTPTIIFLDENFSVIGNNMGFLQENELLELLKFIHEEKYVDTSFEEYQDSENK